MKVRRLFIILWLAYFCLPARAKAQGINARNSGDAYIASAEVWKLKKDSVNANGDIRKAISEYSRQGKIREAAEAWLTLENYYAFFHGPGYGPRIAYYEQALKLFNQAHIKNRASDTRRILGNFYLQSAGDWKKKGDSVKCNSDLRSAITVFLKNGQDREAAESWLTLENCYSYFQGHGYGPRIAYYKKALALFTRAHINDRAAATLTVLGDFYKEQGRHKEALSVLNQSLAMYKKSEKIDLRRLYSVLGDVNRKLGNYDRTLEYDLLSVKAAEVAGDTSLMVGYLLNRVGTSYANIRDFKRSLNYFDKALHFARKKNELDGIIIFSRNVAMALSAVGRPAEGYRLLVEIQRTYLPKDLNNRLIIHVATIDILTSLKRLGAAKKYVDTLLRLEQQVDKADFRRAAIWHSLAKHYSATKNYSEAQVYTTKFERWSTLSKDKSALINALAIQYKLDSAKGDYVSEIKNYRRFINLRDKMYSEKKIWQIAQVDIAYQTEKKDQLLKAKETNIAMLSKQARLQAINYKQQKTTQNLAVGGAVLLAMLLGLSYNRYRLKQRVNRQLQLQQAEINEQNQSLTKLINEKDNLLEEKEWLMKEIHHRVKNNLQVVISLLNTQSSYMKDPIAYQAIRESQHRMQSISLIHQKLYQSDNLAMVNMPAYIGDLVQYLSNSFDIAGQIDFQLDISDIDLEVTKSVPLGLILNEAITNSLKYAFPDRRSGSIYITLTMVTAGHYELTVRDNGVGLSVEIDPVEVKTLGMSLMRGLSKQLSGTFSIINNNGVTIIVGFKIVSSLKTGY
ncbi:histidine kinase dimerization/phosphoacceptor domain -containing protein [Pedobacter metabolipauper]|uniref:histidine kinase n=1 Tax=Pedobacter metabolipauper TaxID=425513 RepID=A0A4R6SWZ4_9SPHI|nr:histidine kinase dimerization/phosphoacceptor domain -containing protein [Pedobacter metabolipauper]TDQ08682.1 two-component sensor histidine kinase [Pedobacter metabolipauper]